ncbi:hypothetical protein TMEC54S_00065 [Thauera mechernichensis]
MNPFVLCPDATPSNGAVSSPPFLLYFGKTDSGLTEWLQPKWSRRSSGNSTCRPNGGSWP